MVLNTNKRAVNHCPFIVPFVSLIKVTQHAYISKCDGNFIDRRQNPNLRNFHRR